MFEGYYGRRRLKTFLVTFLGLIVFFLLIIRETKNVDDEYFNENLLEPIENQSKTFDVQQSKGIISHLEFRNSPYLDLESLRSSKIIPIIILSKAAHIEVRDAIRRTWGFNRAYQVDDLRVRLFFLVGTDDFMAQRTRMEQIVFDDVIQVNLPDMYSFIAYKELSALKWIRTYLPEKRFFIKTEDHVILNMKIFVEKFVPLIEPVSSEQLVIGWFGAEHMFSRGKYQKFIDSIMFASSNNVHYALSLLYAMTAPAADEMIKALKDIELIEYPGDPFVTGILRDVANVKITNLPDIASNLHYETSVGNCASSFKKNSSLILCTSSLYKGASNSMQEYFDAWNVLIGLS